MQNPLNKVVFIQKIAAFSSRSFTKIIRLNYVSSSWADTIQNYSFHLFDKLVRGLQTSDDCRNIFARVLQRNVLWLLNALLSSNSLLDRVNSLLRIACRNSKSKTEDAKFVLDKIVEVGGADLLRTQLSSTDNYGDNCLMLLCSTTTTTSHFLPLELLKYVIKTAIRVCGPEFFKTQQLDAKHKFTGKTFFMCFCFHPSISVEAMQFLLDTMEEVEGGGTTQQKKLCVTTHQFEAMDKRLRTSIMHICGNRSAAASAKVLHVMLEKIVEVGGARLLQSQISSVDRGNHSCLMLACLYSSSSIEMIELLIGKILETGGPELLKTQLAAVTSETKLSCIMMACSNESCVCSEVVELVLKKIVDVGGPDLLSAQLAARDEFHRNCLMFICDNKEQSPKTMRLVVALLCHCGLFKEQYTKLSDSLKMKLKQKASIEDDSWVPDPVSVAEVKRILLSGESV